MLNKLLYTHLSFISFTGYPFSIDKYVIYNLYNKQHLSKIENMLNVCSTYGGLHILRKYIAFCIYDNSNILQFYWVKQFMYAYYEYFIYLKSSDIA